jgi:hypothetical protein
MISVSYNYIIPYFTGFCTTFFKKNSNLNQLQTLIFSGFDMGFVFEYGETKTLHLPRELGKNTNTG